MQELLEREDKWDVDERFNLPKLDGIIAGGQVDHDTVELDQCLLRHAGA